MRWKLMVVPALASFFVIAALSARAQVTYSAEQGKQPFTVGAGVANFSDDWGIQNPRQIGITMWVDWRPPLPSVLNGLGLSSRAAPFNGRLLPISRAIGWTPLWVVRCISFGGTSGFVHM